jgi:hypothetical protein
MSVVLIKKASSILQTEKARFVGCIKNLGRKLSFGHLLSTVYMQFYKSFFYLLVKGELHRIDLDPGPHGACHSDALKILTLGNGWFGFYDSFHKSIEVVSKLIPAK